MIVECDEWVMALYDGEIFPGVIKKVCHDGTVCVQCMEYEQNKNHFRWPAVDDIIDYRWENVIGSIKAPEITGVHTKKVSTKMCML